MFQDAGAPGPPPGGLTKSQLGTQELRALTTGTNSAAVLTDVPAASPQRPAIAEAVGLGVLPASHGAFHPSAPLTQAQLAAALGTVLHAPARSVRARFTSAHAGSGSAVTPTQLATTLAAVFTVPTTAAQKLAGAGRTSLHTDATVTRAQAAAVLDAAIATLPHGLRSAALTTRSGALRLTPPQGAPPCARLPQLVGTRM
jgi:S-layer homology domain